MITHSVDKELPWYIKIFAVLCKRIWSNMKNRRSILSYILGKYYVWFQFLIVTQKNQGRASSVSCVFQVAEESYSPTKTCRWAGPCCHHMKKWSSWGDKKENPVHNDFINLDQTSGSLKQVLYSQWFKPSVVWKKKFLV